MSLQLTEGEGASTALVVRKCALLATGARMDFAGPQPGDPDWQEWLDSTDADERARVREVLQALKEIAHARNFKAGARAAALQRTHLGWGWSAKTLLNLFFVYRCGGHRLGDLRKVGPQFDAGDWRVLLRSFATRDGGLLPEEFKRWLNEQWAQFKGRTDCVNATWRHVVYEIWLKDKPVPAFGTCTDWCLRTGRNRPHPKLLRPGELPEGFTIHTFRRALPKRAAIRRQIAHGYLAAHGAQPDQVLTDRGQLMPLMRVILDDWRGDVRCVWEQGNDVQVVYPLLVLGYDAACAVDVANCLKPRSVKGEQRDLAGEQPEGQRTERHGVSQDMALIVVVETLRTFGFPPWKITFVHENAAACIPSWAKRFLEGIYGERIGFEATSIFREKMSAHGFTEGGGCPWSAGKAALESFWHLLAIQTANLAGATGPRYDATHGELKAIEKYTLGLHKRAHDLPELIARLRTPLRKFAAVHGDLERVLKMLRFRNEHALQGFDRVKWWRSSPAQAWQPWETFARLTTTEQDAAEICNPLESPAERFCRLLDGVERTPADPDVLDFLIGEKFTARVRDGKITVDRVAHGNVPLVFRETDHPLLDESYEGRTFEAALAPGAGRIVLTENGRILGSVAQQGRVSAADKEALHREIGRVRAARVNDREALAGYYLADTDDALAELRAHNEAVLAAPELAAAQAQARIAGGRKKKEPTATDILLAAPDAAEE